MKKRKIAKLELNKKSISNLSKLKGGFVLEENNFSDPVDSCIICKSDYTCPSCVSGC